MFVGERGTALFGVVAEGIDGPVFVKDLAGRYLMANEAAARAVGRTRDGLIGSTDADIFAPDALAHVLRADARVLEEGRALHWDEELTVWDGRRLRFHTTKVPWRDATGRVAGVFGFSQPVDRLAPSLEAERGPGARDRLAVIAHELRSPLHALRLALDLQREQIGDDARLGGTVERLDRQVDRLSRLVDDLFDEARHRDEGRAREEVELRAVLSEVVETHRPLFTARDVALVLDAAPGPVRVRGDRTQIGRVAVNLLDNARKFTPAGGRVTVRIAPRAGEAILEVVDDGIGIERERLGRVLRSGDSTPPPSAIDPKGLGLGLGMVQRIVESHGGRTSVHSDGPGRGTSVRVVLPSAP